MLDKVDFKIFEFLS